MWGFLVLAALGWIVWLWRSERRAKRVDVLHRLAEEASEQQIERNTVIGRLKDRDSRDLRIQKYVYQILGAAFGVGIRTLGASVTPLNLALAGLIGAAAGSMLLRVRREKAQRRLARRIRFELPLVMERVVMGVSAGLDVLPALEEACRTEARANSPMADLLSKVINTCRAGGRLEESLERVADESKDVAVRHAFLHLALAAKEGGELVRPLRELSDATQQHYQESIEEEIARLPVKATVPLLCMFAGVIVLFITGPLVQFSKFSNKDRMQSAGTR